MISRILKLLLSHPLVPMLIMTSSLAPNLHSQTCPELLNRISYGECSAIAVQGDYLFGSFRDLLIVWDISDPQHRVTVATMDLPPSPAMLINNGILYTLGIMRESGGEHPVLIALDILDPRHPYIVSSAAIDYGASEMQVYDQYIYIFYSWKIQIVDISNPMQPSVAATMDDLPSSEGAVEGNRLYLATYSLESGAGVDIYDISEPLHPNLLGSWNYGIRGTFIYGLVAMDKFFYVLIDLDWPNYQLVSVDAADPTHPQSTSQQDCYSPRDIAVGEGWAFILRSDTSSVRMVVDALSLADTSVPSLEGTYQFDADAGSLQSILPVEERLFVLQKHGDLWCLDAAEPAEIHLQWHYKIAVIREALSEGSILYIATHDGELIIVNVANPMDPLEISRAKICNEIEDMEKRGGYLYLAADRQGMIIVDVNDPSHVSVVGCFEPGGYSKRIILQGNLAALQASNVHIVDITNPAQPEPVGSFATDGDCMLLEGNILYCGWTDLHLYDVSQPSQPLVLSTLDLNVESSWCRMRIDSMAIQDATLYLTVNCDVGVIPTGDPIYPGLYVVDISNPAVPFKRSYYGDQGYAGLIRWRDYLAVGMGGVRMAYIHNGSDPFFLGEKAVPGFPWPFSATNSILTMSDLRIVYLFSLLDCDQLKVPPQAEFSWDPAPAVAGRKIEFYDRTIGVRTEWLWDFGDGDTSAAQNPAHLYWRAGSYDVTLTAGNPFGSSTITKRVEVAADPEPPPPLPWTYLLPSAADASGAFGSHWRTRLRLENLALGSAAAGIEFLEADRTNAPAAPLALYFVAAVATDNLVTSAAGKPDAHGAFLISLESEAFYLQAEMLNDGEGSVGESLPLIPVEDLFQGGDQTVLIGLRDDDLRHTNIGMINLHTEPVTFQAQFFDSHGVLLGSDMYTVPGRSVHQEDFILRRITGGAVGEAYAVFIPIGSAGRYYVYGSVVDHGTGDFSFLRAERVEADLAEDVFIPAAAHCDGQDQTQWKTDIVIFNPLAETVATTLTFLASGGSNLDVVGREIFVEPGASVRLEDVVGGFFQSEGRFGGVRIEAPSGLMVQSRTYNAKAAGTAGQVVPAVRRDPAAPGNSYRPIYSGALNPAERLNIGFLNMTDQQLFMDVILTEHCNWYADYIGYLAPTLESFGHVQINDIGAGLKEVGIGRICVWVIDSPDVLTYVSVVDSGSGDAKYYPPKP